VSAQSEFARVAEEDGRAALVTVIEGDGLGAKVFVRPDGTPVGSLGDASLDAAALDAADELMWSERSELRRPASASRRPRR
jgi:xanthine/CO dehydrogenase XdhC/CoxF family maturation factor